MPEHRASFLSGIALLLLAVAPLATPARADTLAVTPIAVQRQTAPVGGRYVLFGDVSLDSARRVTFTASLSRGQVGLFRTRRGEVVPLVLTGDRAPSDAGFSFDVPIEGAGNARGDMAFIATTRFPGRTCVFLMRDGVISTVARAGDPAPTRRGGDLFLGFDQIFLLESGEIYFGTTLADPAFPSLPVGRAIIRSGPAGLESVLAPGDRFLGTREIIEAQQFDVSEDGDVLALAAVGDFDLLQQGARVSEIVQVTSGHLSTLASVDLSISGGVDQVRHLAITFDQIHIDARDIASFYASTNDFPLGAYYRNAAGRLFANTRILSEGDRSPLSQTDRFVELGAFGTNAAETLVFHASTKERPAGGLFVRRAGDLGLVALVGETRPDGTDLWHGFLRIDLNEHDAFAFTDFEDLSVQVGVFLGRFIPPPGDIVDQIRSFLDSAGIDRGLIANLTALLDVIELTLSGGENRTAVRLAEALRLEIGHRVDRLIPAEIADVIDAALEDLIAALGGPSPHGPSGSPSGRRRAPIQR